MQNLRSSAITLRHLIFKARFSSLTTANIMANIVLYCIE